MITPHDNKANVERYSMTTVSLADIISYKIRSFPEMTCDVSMCRYLTTWSFIIVLFSPWVYEYIDLLFLTLLTFIAGSGLFYVNPGIAKIPLQCQTPANDGPFVNRMLILNSADKHIIHILFHIVPLLIVLRFYYTYYKTRKFGTPTLISFIIVLFYLIIMNVENVYKGMTSWIVIYITVFTICYIYI
jgi:hypothetical protein